jgi:hypothetical protein
MDSHFAGSRHHRPHLQPALRPSSTLGILKQQPSPQ